MIRTNLFYPLIAGFVMLTLTACQSSEPGQQQSSQPAKKVDVITLAPQTVTLKNTLPARAVAYRKAEVRPQVNGIIDKRLFEEGGEVKAGQRLYQIEPALYEAQLANAKAQLASAKAALKTAQAKEERYKGLMSDNAISKQDYDDALSTFEQAEAEIKVQQAAVKTAETNLGYTHVVAPISGTIGKSAFTEGALVTAQQANVLATINQLDPIYIDISQPSKQLLALRKRVISRELNDLSAPKVNVSLEDGTEYDQVGTLQFAGVDVDTTTGDVVVRAIIPNPNHLLLPGMFLRATIIEGELKDVILAPQKGVSFDKNGSASALVITADNKVEKREITVGQAFGENWLVKSGLNVGDQVIVEGLQSIGPEANVSIDKNTLQTANTGA